MRRVWRGCPVSEIEGISCALAARADVEKNAADYIEAIDLLQQVLKREPAELRSLFNLGLVYRQTSMLDEALAVWKRFLETNPPQGWADEARKQIREILVKLFTKRFRGNVSTPLARQGHRRGSGHPALLASGQAGHRRHRVVA